MVLAGESLLIAGCERHVFIFSFILLSPMLEDNADINLRNHNLMSIPTVVFAEHNLVVPCNFVVEFLQVLLCILAKTPCCIASNVALAL